MHPASRLRTLLVLALLAPLARTAGAQAADDAPTDAVFTRAQRLVNSGHAIRGRAIVDSVVRATPTTSARYPEALFWRASLAATATDAERDYQRIAIEHPLSPRAEDALVRLAQLEMARGDDSKAERHLERLLLEHPASAGLPRWYYWLARARFAQSELARGCAALVQAGARAPLADVELANEIAYLRPRCNGVDTSAAARPAAASRAAAAPPASPAPPPRAAATAAAPEASGARSVEYTVQVTAYDDRAPADRLRARLAAKGWEARVVPAGTMWRVRVGRYATRAEAQAAAKRLEAQGTSTWVTEAEPR